MGPSVLLLKVGGVGAVELDNEVEAGIRVCARDLAEDGLVLVQPALQGRAQ